MPSCIAVMCAMLSHSVACHAMLHHVFLRCVSAPIAKPQLLASTTPHLSAMTPCCAPEPPASVFTTVGANSMLQSYATPSSVAQSTHRQRPAAHDPLSIPAQSQHWQANSTAFAEPISTLQQQSSQPSVIQSTHGQHPAVSSGLYD